MNAHRNLILKDGEINRTLEKISTGLEIVRGADGPASLVLSEQLRSQVSGLRQAVKNTEVAISMVQTTEAALEEVSRGLIDLRKLAVHASNEAVNDTLSLKADQEEVNNILQSLDRIAKQTSFGSRKLLDGSGSVSGTAVGQGLEFISGTAETESSSAEGYEVKVIDGASKSFLISDNFPDTEFIDPDEVEVITLVESGNLIKYKIGEGEQIGDAVSKLNDLIKSNGLDLTASVYKEDQIFIEHNQYGEDHDFLASSSTSGFLSDQANTLTKSILGTDVSGTIGGYAATGKGEILTADKGTPANGVAIKYSGIPEEFSEEGSIVGRVLVQQESLLFQLGASFGETANLSLTPTFSHDLGRGIDNESGYESIKDIDLTNFQGAQDALKLVVSASNDISSLRGRLGALQKNSLESTANYLRNSVENIVASESTIRDADIAEKTAELIRGQIQFQSASIATLHAANSPKAVINLLGSIQS